MLPAQDAPAHQDAQASKLAILLNSRQAIEEKIQQLQILEQLAQITSEGSAALSAELKISQNLLKQQSILQHIELIKMGGASEKEHEEQVLKLRIDLVSKKSELTDIEERFRDFQNFSKRAVENLKEEGFLEGYQDSEKGAELEEVKILRIEIKRHQLEQEHNKMLGLIMELQKRGGAWSIEKSLRELLDLICDLEIKKLEQEIEIVGKDLGVREDVKFQLELYPLQKKITDARHKLIELMDGVEINAEDFQKLDILRHRVCPGSNLKLKMAPKLENVDNNEEMEQESSQEPAELEQGVRTRTMNGKLKQISYEPVSWRVKKSKKNN